MPTVRRHASESIAGVVGKRACGSLDLRKPEDSRLGIVRRQRQNAIRIRLQRQSVRKPRRKLKIGCNPLRRGCYRHAKSLVDRSRIRDVPFRVTSQHRGVVVAQQFEPRFCICGIRGTIYEGSSLGSWSTGITIGLGHAANRNPLCPTTGAIRCSAPIRIAASNQMFSYMVIIAGRRDLRIASFHYSGRPGDTGSFWQEVRSLLTRFGISSLSRVLSDQFMAALREGTFQVATLSEPTRRSPASESRLCPRKSP